MGSREIFPPPFERLEGKGCCFPYGNRGGVLQRISADRHRIRDTANLHLRERSNRGFQPKSDGALGQRYRAAVTCSSISCVPALDRSEERRVGKDPSSREP